MGRTMIEKIIARHSNEEVRAGSVVWMTLDVRSARDFGGASVVKHLQTEYPDRPVNDPAKTVFTFDCNAPAVTIPYANNQHICRQFARKHGIPLFDVDAGIGTHVLLENGYVLPGMTAVGTDSHFNIFGAIGAFGQGMGDTDIAFSFKFGRTWFEVPPSMKIVIRGYYDYPTTAKDLALYILGRLGASGALGRSIEFYGEQIDRLNLAERLTLCSMATEMGAVCALIPPNEEILDFCRSRAREPEALYVAEVDQDAEYCEETEMDVSSLPPMAAAPPNPENAHPVSELTGRKVDSVFIGSCTNGRYEDFALAAEFLAGRKVAPGVMAKVVPATREVFSHLLRDGIIQQFHDAGVIVSHASCAGCASGQIGMTGKGEVQVSTSNRNFPGKQGSGDTYLASPVTAMAAAIAGEIVSPEDLI